MKTGKTGESIVKRFLMKHRYDVLGTNIRVYQGKQIGEIDILAFKTDILYIVEVKTMANSGHESGSDDNVWQMTDIFSHKKHSKLRQIRKLMQAMRTGIGDSPDDSDELACVRFMMDPENGMDIELDRGVLFGIRNIKIALAQVTLISDNTCSIEFHPINSGYY